MTARPPDDPSPEPGEPPDEPPIRRSGAALFLAAMAGVLAVIGAVTLVVGGICVAVLTNIGR